MDLKSSLLYMRKELEGHLKIGGSSQLRFKVVIVSKCQGMVSKCIAATAE
jgi:hypothetical protein